jgi:GT2 family glycosyltransferase
VTVYIPAYNAEEFLPRCIEALLRQTCLPDEVLVIDDGSQDQTADIARRYAQVTLVQHLSNLGLGAARNTALRTAKNDVVASLDADCAPEPDWLEYLLRNLGDERTAGVGGCLVEGVRDSLADRWRSAHMPQQWGDRRLENPPFLFGCNNVFRKAAVLACGGYDEAMRTNGEDADLCRRLRKNGWRLIYDPTARATHMRHDTIRSIMSNYWRWIFHGFENSQARLRLSKILRRAVLGNVWHMFGGLAKQDLRAGRLELLPLDFLLLFYFPQQELREWRKLRESNKRWTRSD